MIAAYRPCLPTRAKQAPTGEGWLHEINHDGFRIIAVRSDGRVRLFTKQGYDWSKRYPLVVEALSGMRVSSVVLDGEAVCFGPDGTHDFDGLWNRSSDDSVWLCAFDLLELNGEDLRPKPLLERKKRLAKLLQKDRAGLQYVEHLEGDGPVVFEHACRLGFEGIVSKRANLPYQAGSSKNWIKVKNRAHPSISRVREAFERERAAALRRST